MTSTIQDFDFINLYYLRYDSNDIDTHNCLYSIVNTNNENITLLQIKFDNTSIQDICIIKLDYKINNFDLIPMLTICSNGTYIS